MNRSDAFYPSTSVQTSLVIGGLVAVLGFVLWYWFFHHITPYHSLPTWLMVSIYGAITFLALFAVWVIAAEYKKTLGNQMPSIEFGVESLICRSLYEETTIQFSDIRKIEIFSGSPQNGGGQMIVTNTLNHEITVYAYGLNASYEQILQAFLERIPHLYRPFSTVMLLKSKTN